MGKYVSSFGVIITASVISMILGCILTILSILDLTISFQAGSKNLNFTAYRLRCHEKFLDPVVMATCTLHWTVMGAIIVGLVMGVAQILTSGSILLCLEDRWKSWCCAVGSHILIGLCCILIITLTVLAINAEGTICSGDRQDLQYAFDCEDGCLFAWKIGYVHNQNISILPATYEFSKNVHLSFIGFVVADLMLIVIGAIFVCVAVYLSDPIIEPKDDCEKESE